MWVLGKQNTLLLPMKTPCIVVSMLSVVNGSLFVEDL